MLDNISIWMCGTSTVSVDGDAMLRELDWGENRMRKILDGKCAK